MLYFKALHIIFVVTWFAGLFYIVRLFVYFAETDNIDEPSKSILQKQYMIMQKRLWYGITFPSAILTAFFGLNMLRWYPLTQWLIIKLSLVLGLFIYHFCCHAIFLQQQRGEIRYSGNQMRLYNEVATLFLVAIVFLVVLKSSLDMLWGVIGLVAFAVLLMVAIRIYKRLRKKNITH